MPTLTLAMSNGRNPVSGISFRRVKQEELNGHACRPYSSDGRIGRGQPNGININGSEQSAPDGVKGSGEHGAVIRRKLKRGKAGEKRNGRIYDGNSELSYYNNNGPLKAFPLNNNIKSNSPLGQDFTNTNNSSLPSSNMEISTSLSSSRGSSVADNTKTVPSRPLLQRIGHGQHTQNLPPRLLDPQVANAHIPEAFPMLSKSSSLSESPCSSGSPQLRMKTPPLKSVLRRNGSSQNAQPRKALSTEIVTFAENVLPPGMHELVRDCFIPGGKGCFQHTANLPLLMSTDAAILKRRSSLSLKRKNRITTSKNGTAAKSKTPQYAALKLEESSSMIRSRSTASEMFLQPDILILKACFNIVLSFMGDDKSLLTKNHSRKSIGHIVSSKRKYISHHKRLWRKSSTDARMSSPKTSPTNSLKHNSTERPFSMFVQSPTEASLSVNSDDRKKKVPLKHHSSVANSGNISNTVSGLTVLEKIHFLVNVGLKLEYLRDEIYCLIMKQLVSNPSSYSSALGWILFSLIAGSFPPSIKIASYVESFLQHHRHVWGLYCSERLNRTLQNGPRTNPPSSLEIETTKSREPIRIPVICADDSVRTMTIDPATTSKEMLALMAEKNRMSDFLGFCLVMQAAGKVVNLGAGRFPVLDAVSQVELYAKNKFYKTACRFYYRRDIFSPRDLFCASDEHMALWLTFSQICGGVRIGEYVCKKAADLCLLVAHQYCVRHGIEHIDGKKVAIFCEQRLPPDVFKSDKKNWCKMVSNTLRALAKEQDHMMNPIDVMAQAIRYAMQNLTKLFVRTYSISTFTMCGSICTYTSELTLTLSHVGVTVKQGDEKHFQKSKAEVEESGVIKVPAILMDVPATDLKNVKLDTKRSIFGSTLTITIHGGRSYEIESAHGPEIYSVLSRYIRDILTGANKESKA